MLKYFKGAWNYLWFRYEIRRFNKELEAKALDEYLAYNRGR